MLSVTLKRLYSLEKREVHLIIDVDLAQTTNNHNSAPRMYTDFQVEGRLVHNILSQNSQPYLWSLFKSNPKRSQRLNNCLL